MKLCIRIILSRISVKEAVVLHPSHPDYVILLFADLDRLVGLILNHSDLTECFVTLSSDEFISEILKWLEPQSG